jgi:hypothetical protein
VSQAKKTAAPTDSRPNRNGLKKPDGSCTSRRAKPVSTRIEEEHGHPCTQVMFISAELARQSHRTPTPRELDRALLRIFPEISDDARRTLRGPVKRWHRGAVMFLSSPQTLVDENLLASVWLSLQGLYAAKKKTLIGTLITGLRRKIDSVLVYLPVDCKYRDPCALLQVVNWLFFDDIEYANCPFCNCTC